MDCDWIEKKKQWKNVFNFFAGLPYSTIVVTTKFQLICLDGFAILPFQNSVELHAHWLMVFIIVSVFIPIPYVSRYTYEHLLFHYISRINHTKWLLLFAIKRGENRMYFSALSLTWVECIIPYVREYFNAAERKNETAFEKRHLHLFDAVHCFFFLPLKLCGCVCVFVELTFKYTPVNCSVYL